MNKLKHVFIVLILFVFTNEISSKIYQNPIKAVCIEPVVDLIEESVAEGKSKQEIEAIYSKIPLSPEFEHLFCLRVHQAIFNEVVDIVEENDVEVKVQISTAFYTVLRSRFKKNYYWALKDKFKKIDEIKNNINLACLPEPIDCNKTNFNVMTLQKIITLKMPFFDVITNKIYSVGTRFVFKEKHDDYYLVYIYDSKLNKVIETKIEKSICVEFEKNSNDKKIENFVNLLKFWVNLNKKVIPYIWGGCSMQQLSTHNNFKLITGYDNTGKRAKFYIRNDQLTTPSSGFDCSGLILRAAQICHIPYFFKNSFTIVKYLKPLSQDEQIETGDLLWFAGHIVVISDVQNDLCIEARGYKSGYGRIHEIAISNLIKGVKNLRQLKEVHLSARPIEVLNKAGIVAFRFDECKILKLKSLWDCI